MNLDDKQLSFVPKILLPKMILTGARGETLLNDLSAEETFLFISSTVDKLYCDNSWFKAPFLEKIICAREPLREDIDLYTQTIKEKKPKAIVAVGGGSVMDLAKLVKGSENITFIVLPTTLGSGAEVSQHAVFIENGVKKSLSSINHLPDAVIINPEYLHSLSEEQMTFQVFDGIAHAAESLVSKLSHPLSEDFALQALQIFSFSLKEIANGSSIKNMIGTFQRAAIWAGISQSSAGVGLAHALAHVLGPKAKISHSQAVYTFILDVLELNELRFDGKDKRNMPNGLVEKMKFLHENLGSKKLVFPSDITVEGLAEMVRKDVNVYTNPYLPTVEEISKIIRKHI